MTLFCSCQPFYNTYTIQSTSDVQNVWEAFCYIGSDAGQTPDCDDMDDISSLGRSVSGTISRLLRWLLKCSADKQTPQLTGRGWALIWECQNLLLSHHSRGEADYLFINEISWQCVSVWHISEHILSNEDDKILEFSQTILIDNKHQRRNY